MKERLEEMVSAFDLGDAVRVLGGRKPAQVIEAMKGADIFLFTSNYLEGWGAVVNEAMQCGCALVASGEAGSVPFLIEDGFSGLVYEDGKYESFEKKLLKLFDKPELVSQYGESAFHTINNTWNAKRAAAELVRFCAEFLEGKDPLPAEYGPVSRAGVIKAPGFVRTLEEKNRLE